jgi:hypothetical protein
MSNKKTAVDIFHDRVIEMLGRKRPLTTNEVANVWAELKEVERQHIENAYKQGHEDGYYYADGLVNDLAETYYKETYED